MSTSATKGSVVTGAQAAALVQALARAQVRDHDRVLAGELKPSDLFFIPAAMARESIVRWADADTRRRR
jgi:23S rRNA A2030 N6-methylase RlmJ